MVAIDPMVAWELLERAAELPAPQRRSFIESSDSADPPTRAFVLDLISRSVDGPALPGIDFSAPPQIRARYRLLLPLGEGGFGRVYLGRAMSPPKRLVAVKVLRPGLDSERVLRRFAAEQEALARLDHPGIAGIFESGLTDEGRPYFAMPLVRGEPILRWCDARQLGIEERVGLFGQLLDAIAHAHRRGVLHRDLKPANILVSEEDGRPQIRVIDFGIARSLISAERHEEALGGATLTEIGTPIGTPEYMSPEQAAGEPAAVDIRSDLYSLGVVLYQLLCGEYPIDSETLRRGGLIHIADAIRSAPPPPPSRRVQIAAPDAAATPWEARALRERSDLVERLRGPLDAIALKAISIEQRDRYADADRFAEDLLRWSRREPVSARPPSRIDTLRFTIRRNRLAASVLLAVLLTLSAGLVSTAFFAIAAQRQADARETEAQRFRTMAGFLGTIFSGIDPEQARGRDTTLLRSMLDDASESLGDRVASGAIADPRILAELDQVLGVAYTRLLLLEPADLHLTRSVEAMRSDRAATADTALFDGLFELSWLRGRQYRMDESRALLREALDQIGWPTRPGSNDDPRALEALAAGAMVGLYSDGNAVREIGELAQPLTDAGLAHLAAVRSAWRGVADRATRVLGAGSPQMRRIHHRIGRSLDNVGGTEEARIMLAEAIEISARELGRDHPITLEGVRYISTVLREDPDAVVALIEDWLPEFDGVYGPLSPASANMRNNLGWALHMLGRSEEALPLLRTARDGTFASFGPRNDFSTWVETTLINILDTLALEEEFEQVLIDRWARWAPVATELDERARGSFAGLRNMFIERFGREPAIDPRDLEALRLE
jgi:serine/threonine protein kinase